MIITCPECSTRYQVDPGALGDGRKVRCVRCGHSWVQEPEEDAWLSADAPAEIPDDGGDAGDMAEDAAPVSLPEGDPAPLRAVPSPLVADPPPSRARAATRSAARRAKEPGRRLATALWIVLFVVVAAVVGSAVGLRGMVMATWPASEAVYDLVGLGLEPPGAGLELRGVRWRAAEQDGASMLRIEGEITNQTDMVRDVPRLQGIIYDAEERELQRWSFVAPEQRLLPGETVSFETTLRNPAAGASRLTIAFESRRSR